jgi:hypothetical protein
VWGFDFQTRYLYFVLDIVENRTGFYTETFVNDVSLKIIIKSRIFLNLRYSKENISRLKFFDTFISFKHLYGLEVAANE